MGMIELREIAQDACIEDGDFELKFVERNLTFCQRAYGDLYLYQFPNVKTVPLEITDRCTARLPKDYVLYTKIGLLDTVTKRIVVLGYDPSLTTVPADICQCDQSQAETQVQQIFSGVDDGFNLSFLNPQLDLFGGAYGEIYGLGGGWNKLGFYKVDKENWQIQLSGHINYTDRMRLVLEYKADGTSEGVKYVPSEAKEAIINFTLSKVNKKKDFRLSEGYKRDWQVEYKRLQSMYRGMTKEEWQDLFLKNAKQTVPNV